MKELYHNICGFRVGSRDCTSEMMSVLGVTSLIYQDWCVRKMRSRISFAHHGMYYVDGTIVERDSMHGLDMLHPRDVFL